MLKLGFGSQKGRSQTDETQTTTGRETQTAGTFDTGSELDWLSQVLQTFELNDVIAENFQLAQQQAQGAIQNIFAQMSEQYLPQLMGAQVNSGAYGGTTAQLLANDAFARATNQGAELALGQANTLTGQSISNRQLMLNQFAQLLQANLQQNVTREYDSKTVGNSITKTRGMNLNAAWDPAEAAKLIP